MKKIKIAQIGTSAYSHGKFIFESLRKQPDIFDIVGYALPEHERKKFPNQCTAFNGYREMTVDEIMNDDTIEAVAIETEEIYLTEYALLAARHNKHIHLEKPGGIVADDFEKLICEMKSSGKVFHTGYMYRYNPEIIKLKERIKNGELGELISIEAQMSCSEPDDLKKWLADFPGGMMFFLGCHLVDLTLQLMGKPLKIIPLNHSTGTVKTDSSDFGMAVFEYDRGYSLVKTCAAEIGGYARRQLVVSGSKATVEIKPLEMFCEGGQYTETRIYNSQRWNDLGASERSALYDRYDDMMRAFATYVAEPKTENPYTLDYELYLYKTLLECCR